MIPLRACIVLSLLLSATFAESAVYRWRAPAVQQYVVPRAPVQPAYVPPSRPREDRVLELPEDGGLFHLVIVGDATDPLANVLREYVAAAPRLTSVKRQTKYWEVASSHWWVKQYFGGETKPLILLQDDRGQVVYKASGANLPREAEELADEVELAIAAYAANCGPECNRPSKTRPKVVIPDTRQGVANTFGLGVEDLVWLVAFAIVGILIWRTYQTRAA